MYNMNTMSDIYSIVYNLERQKTINKSSIQSFKYLHSIASHKCTTVTTLIYTCI